MLAVRRVFCVLWGFGLADFRFMAFVNSTCFSVCEAPNIRLSILHFVVGSTRYQMSISANINA